MIITAYRQLTKQEASGGPGFIPAVADCRYRAPLSPRLVRPCPTPQAASGRLLAYIIQHFPSRIKQLTIKFLYSFFQKGFTFFKVLLYYKINWKEWQSCTFSPIPLRARGSAGRAFGSHPRGRGFKSLRVHHSAKIRTLHCSQCLRVNHQDRGSLKDGPLSSFSSKTTKDPACLLRDKPGLSMPIKMFNPLPAALPQRSAGTAHRPAQ